MIDVVLVDDEALVRTGLRMILRTAGDLRVVAEAGTAAEAMAAIAEHAPRVVVLDVRMPGTGGLEVLRRIRELPEPPEVIMLTTFDTDEHIHTALREGASGFLLKDTEPAELIAAVRAVAEGSAMLSPTVTRRLLDTYADVRRADHLAARRRLAVLSPREADVVRGVARGLSNQRIARELGMTESTVKAHVSRAMAKLDLANRVQVALLVRDARLE